MQSRRASFKQSDATRLLRAVVAAGRKPTSLKVGQDGFMEVVIDGDGGNASTNPWDDVLK